MRIYDKITPEGTKDVLFEQCEAKRRVGRKLSKFFRNRGFDEVMTPGLEFYDVFYSNATYFPQETMYKLTDSKSRLLVMRPDCTIPIARLTGTRLSGLPKPIRLYYDQNIYRNNPTMKGSSDEQSQMGVELIGVSSLKADLEVLELAASSLELCGIENFRLEICHIGFFKALMENLVTDSRTKELVRELVEAKNYAALGDALSNVKPCPAVEALKKLPGLFGTAEVIEQAATLIDDRNVAGILEDLATTYKHLQALGLGDKVIVDLGLVNQAEYYTGIIFRGYVAGIGEPVLSGGRYDSLMGDFGDGQAATGFAVNVDLVSRVLLEQGNIMMPKTEVLVYAAKEYSTKAFKEIAQLTEQGIRCEYSVFNTLEQSKQY
ncbi:MAG: ATP phosphoribosyltransferase regulatory subunit, partial [Oscillospiraceae bacterium]